MSQFVNVLAAAEVFATRMAQDTQAYGITEISQVIQAKAALVQERQDLQAELEHELGPESHNAIKETLGHNQKTQVDVDAIIAMIGEKTQGYVIYLIDDAHFYGQPIIAFDTTIKGEDERAAYYFSFLNASSVMRQAVANQAHDAIGLHDFFAFSEADAYELWEIESVKSDLDDLSQEIQYVREDIEKAEANGGVLESESEEDLPPSIAELEDRLVMLLELKTNCAEVVQFIANAGHGWILVKNVKRSAELEAVYQTAVEDDLLDDWFGRELVACFGDTEEADIAVGFFNGHHITLQAVGEVLI